MGVSRGALSMRNNAVHNARRATTREQARGTVRVLHRWLEEHPEDTEAQAALDEVAQTLAYAEAAKGRQ